MSVAPKKKKSIDPLIKTSFVDGVSSKLRCQIELIIQKGLKTGTDPSEICSLVVVMYEGTCTKVDKEICQPKPRAGRLALLITSVYKGEEKSFFWTKKNAKV